MKENKTIKISLGTTICIVIIIILVIALALVWYLNKDDKINQKDINNENVIVINSIESNKKNNVISNITNVNKTSESEENNKNIGSDEIRPIYEIEKAYVQDGYFYYSINGEKTEKYEELNNIVKVKVFNIGTGINQVPFLITKEGNIYQVGRDSDENIKAVIYKELSGYKVEDILDKTGEMLSIFKLKLKDGTIKEVTVDIYKEDFL